MQSLNSLVNDRYLNNNLKTVNTVNENITNMIDNTQTMRNPELVKEKQKIAMDLADKFQDYNSISFFLKVAWKLPEPKIHKLMTDALELGNNPVRYFVACCKREMA